MSKRRLLLGAALAAVLSVGPGFAGAQPTPPASGPVSGPAAATGAAMPGPVVEKQNFTTQNYVTRGGATIASLRIGYQTAGTLNAAGDNAILVAHFFSGTSEAFGRLQGGQAGWWDSIIGPGKPIDTDRYFVIASDTLVNLNAPDQHTITTGPASVNPATGRPFGVNFPVVSIRDFVEVQKRLLDQLGVKRLALVAGPSMGALQAIEWAAAYPEMIDRVMPVIGTGEVDAWQLGVLELWAQPIRMDPNWRGGDYYAQGREPPSRGLTEALKQVTLQSRDRGWATQFGRRPAEGQDPARRLQDRFAVAQWLEDAAAARAKVSDANSFLYLVRANQLFLNEYDSSDAALARSTARWLVVPSKGDRVFPIEYGRELAETLRRTGRPVQITELSGGLGHLEGVANIAQAAEAIRSFLAQ